MNGFDLKDEARLIFAEALRAVDAGAAVRQAVKISSDSQLIVVDEVHRLTEKTRVYAVAVGKAAYPMALALDEILGGKLNAGVISGVVPEDSSRLNSTEKSRSLSSKWRVFAGGHPLPNEASLAAAAACFELLEAANDENAIVIFLISGGGSAMLESPIDDSITLADLREANKILVSCGASISEINQIRRAFSRIKGGGLARFAPNAAQISLIVSDTETGDEKSVASGPTFENEAIDIDEINSIIERCELNEKLPKSIIRSLNQIPLKKPQQPKNIRRHYVLLDNRNAVNAAADFAKSRGFIVEIADDISQQEVQTGCAELVSRINKMLAEINENEVACLISGGEFSCPVRGAGIGGRNSETAFRMALLFDENRNNVPVNSMKIAFLSAGTDGIDGNSPSAGAISDDTTVSRAKTAGFDARLFWDNSDAYTFFDALDDTLITGSTGTNVRDLRIMIART